MHPAVPPLGWFCKVTMSGYVVPRTKAEGSGVPAVGPLLIEGFVQNGEGGVEARAFVGPRYRSHMGSVPFGEIGATPISRIER
jgi:hypothetical protein